MGFTLGQKLIKSHLVSGDMTPGSEVGIRIDQTLTQDATGTMAYLEFEAMGVERVRTELSVAYIDHNTLQTGFENADDHRFIQTVCKKHGIRFWCRRRRTLGVQRAFLVAQLAYARQDADLRHARREFALLRQRREQGSQAGHVGNNISFFVFFNILQSLCQCFQTWSGTG